MPTRILIVDDHETIRRGVRDVLESTEDLQVVAEAGNGEEAVEKTKSLRPDIIIMDVSMPVRNGFSAASEIKKTVPDARIVMFSAFEMPDFVAAAKDLGLNGYVLKSDDGPGLLRAIEAVRHNGTYFPS